MEGTTMPAFIGPVDNTAFLNPSAIMGTDPTMGVQPIIKLEDLNKQQQQQQQQQHSASGISVPGANPSGKPVKKRKSWGQVLPEPTTNLPPRKRAKTAEEKEQRRIERVKRNRLAAHNSRERKRQEVELLQCEKDALAARLNQAEHQNYIMMSKMQQMQLQLNSLKALVPAQDLAKIPEMQDIDLSVLSWDSLPDTSLLLSNTIDPRSASYDSLSPPENMSSPSDDSSSPSSPREDSMPPMPDQTQHSAEMLWDLQCQSGKASEISRQVRDYLWMALNTALTALNLRLSFQTLLLTSFSTWSHSLQTTIPLPSQMTASSTILCMNLPSDRLPQSQISTPSSPASLNPYALSSSPCSLTLARLLVATGLALQMKTTSSGAFSPLGVDVDVEAMLEGMLDMKAEEYERHMSSMFLSLMVSIAEEQAAKSECIPPDIGGTRLVPAIY